MAVVELANKKTGDVIWLHLKHETDYLFVGWPIDSEIAYTFDFPKSEWKDVKREK